MVLMFLWVLRRMLRGTRRFTRRRCGSRLLSLRRLTMLLNWRGLPWGRRLARGRRFPRGGRFALGRNRARGRRFALGRDLALRRGLARGKRFALGRRFARLWIDPLARGRDVAIDIAIRHRARMLRRHRVGEIPGPRCCSNRRIAMVGGGAELWIRARSLFMLTLNRGGLDVAIARRGQFRRSGLGPNAVAAAVETDAIHSDVVDDSLVIDVGNVRRTDIDHFAIVEKMPALPIAALVASAAVAVAVIDTTIKSDGGAPIARVPKINAFPEGPVAGSP